MNLGHGGNVEEICRKYNLCEKDIIDFSANINPLGISKKVKEEIIKALDKIERYPDITYHDLKMGISEYEGIDYNNIFLGNGAAEVIFNVIRGLKPKKVLLPAPTFSEYEDGIRAINGEIVYYKLNRENFKLDDGFLEAIDKSIHMLFICNPNNPTGQLVSREFLIKVLDKSSNTKVVIDESFLDFIEDKSRYSLIDMCKDYENLIVVKSLTKFFSFPGIRVGYGITGNAEFIRKINKVSVPWSINTVASTGAIVALKEREYQKNSIDFIKNEKVFLYNELCRFNELEVFEGSVNFIFFKTRIDINLKEELVKYGIIIRSCSNYIGLGTDYYRVAVRTREQNEKLIYALRKVFNK